MIDALVGTTSVLFALCALLLVVAGPLVLLGVSGPVALALAAGVMIGGWLYRKGGT